MGKLLFSLWARRPHMPPRPFCLRGERGSSKVLAMWVLGAGLMAAGPGTAQGFGQQPSGQQPFGQQPFGQPPGQPYVQQPPFSPPPFSPPNAQSLPSLVGTWSGQRQGDAGPVHQTDAFSGDGKFVTVAELGPGLVRVWGYYRTSPAGQNAIRVEFQVAGYLPQQFCAQAPGGPLVCRPFQLPMSDASLVTFTSPDSFQASSVQNPAAGPIQETRDPNPYLLQRQVPAQLVVQTNPPPTPYPAPSPYPAPPPYPTPMPYPRPTAGPACNDLQQRRICNINDGHLVPSGGCLVCVSP